MSQIQSPNQKLLDRYLTEIGYQSIPSSLPPEKIVVLDWEGALAKVTDLAGNEWARYKGNADIDYGPSEFDVSGGYMATMRSAEKDYITIDIYHMKSEQHALDYMLKLVSLTSARQISAGFEKYPDCFADFCLTGTENSERRARFVYGNMYVDVSGEGANNTKSVVPVAKKIHEMMRGAERPASEAVRSIPLLQLKVGADTVQVGKTITVTTDADNLPESEWATEVRTRFENLEKVGSDRGRYVFLAKLPGEETVKAVLMNKRTLQFTEVEKKIKIEP